MIFKCFSTVGRSKTSTLLLPFSIPTNFPTITTGFNWNIVLFDVWDLGIKIHKRQVMPQVDQSLNLPNFGQDLWNCPTNVKKKTHWENGRFKRHPNSNLFGPLPKISSQKLRFTKVPKSTWDNCCARPFRALNNSGAANWLRLRPCKVCVNLGWFFAWENWSDQTVRHGVSSHYLGGLWWSNKPVKKSTLRRFLCYMLPIQNEGIVANSVSFTKELNRKNFFPAIKTWQFWWPRCCLGDNSLAKSKAFSATDGNSWGTA